MQLDVRNPIKRRLSLGKIGEQVHWIYFQYEKLPPLCFLCGYFGHNDSTCELRISKPELLENKPYGVWLHAPSGRTKQLQIGAPWLAEGPHVLLVISGISNNNGNVEDMVVDNDSRANSQKRGEKDVDNNVHGNNTITDSPQPHKKTAGFGIHNSGALSHLGREITSEVGLAEVILNDPNRKRLTVDENTHANHNSYVEEELNSIMDVQKNGAAAGPGFQPCRDQ